MSEDEFKLMSHADFLRARDTGALDPETAARFEKVYREEYSTISDFFTPTRRHEIAHERATKAIAKTAFEQSRSNLGALRAESVLREKKATMSEDEFKLAVFSAKARKKSRRESEAEVAMSFTDMARQDDALMDFRPEAVLSQPQTQTAFPSANNQNPGNQQRIVNTAPRKVKTETGGVLDVTNEDVSAVPA